MSAPVIALVIVAIMFVGYGIYSNTKLRDKCLIIYHRPSGQVLEQFAKLTDQTIDIDNKRFTILPDRRSFRWYVNGIHKYFPTWVIVYTFYYYYRFPVDPRNYKNIVVSPSVIKTMNNESRMKAFGTNLQSQAAGKKGGIIDKWLPIILLILFVAIVIVGFFVFSMNGDMNVIKKTLQDILTNK